MAVIEYEPRTTSAQGNVVFVAYTTRRSALLISAGDEPQSGDLVMSDDDLVDSLLAATEPVADDHFVD
jgi:hypothetical protein